MLTVSDNHIVLGSIGGGSAPVLPDGWDGVWLSPPDITSTTINGKTDVCGLVCNVLDIGDRNYFSCIATGDYIVNVYTDATANTLISTQNVASGVQANWQIDYADCTYQLDTETRQVWVEIVPQSGQSLTMLRFNTNHPSETNTNTPANIVSIVGVLPALTNATSMFHSCLALQSVTLPNLSALTNATNMFYYCLALQSVTLPNLSALTNATSMFHSCLALQSVTLTSLSALTNAANMFLYCYALQSVTLTSLSALTNAANMFLYCLALQSVTLPSLPSLTNTSGMFGTDTEASCLRSLRRLVCPTTVSLKVSYGALQAQELNALFASLLNASGAQTIDVRNQPGSATCDTSIATAKGYTVLTA